MKTMYNQEYEKALKYSQEEYATPSHEHFLHQIALEPENKQHIKEYADFLEGKDLHGIAEVLNTAKVFKHAHNSFYIPHVGILPKGRPPVKHTDKVIPIPTTPLYLHISNHATNGTHIIRIITPSLKDIRKGDSDLPIALWQKLIKHNDVPEFISKFKSPEVRKSILDYTHNEL